MLDISLISYYNDLRVWYEIGLIYVRDDKLARISADMYRFNSVMSEINALYHEANVRLGVSDGVFQVLYTLCALGDGCTQTEVCTMMGISKQTVHSAVRKMERDGLIWLQSSVGRSMKIRLTDAGIALMNATAQQVIDAEGRILEAWTPEEREMHLTLTQKYRDAFREQLDLLVSPIPMEEKA